MSAVGLGQPANALRVYDALGVLAWPDQGAELVEQACRAERDLTGFFVDVEQPALGARRR